MTANDTPATDKNSQPSLIDTGIIWLSAGMGLGFFPWAPGTVGSLAGPPLAWSLQRAGIQGSLWGVCTVLAFLVSVWLCDRAAQLLRAKDPSVVVLDEIVAFLFVFALVPVSLTTAGVGFALFRLFDIWKPWPIRAFEKLPGGLGIMADDAVAGMIAGAILYGMRTQGYVG